MDQHIIFEGSRSTAYKKAAEAKGDGFTGVKVVPTDDSFLVVADQERGDGKPMAPAAWPAWSGASANFVPHKPLDQRIKHAEAALRWRKAHQPHLVQKWEAILADLQAQQP